MSHSRRIRVLIVDDSAVVRRLLTEALSRFSDIEVVGSARDPFEARERILELAPDVLTLDIEMPRMDGLTFLEKLMSAQPMPVVVVSSIAGAGSANAMRALALGAAEVVPKPEDPSSLAALERLLATAVRAAAQISRAHLAAARPAPAAPRAPRVASTGAPAVRINAIGASTGGPRALETLLASFGPDTAGTVIVQHMPPRFTRAFAARLDGVGAMRVKEAEDGDLVTDGTAYVAPGGRHLIVRRNARGEFALHLKDGPLIHHQRPAADVLFDSVAESVGDLATGVLLTGMGVDGARGLLSMRVAGARTIAQDEASSAVFGMPREAIAIGAAEEVLPLGSIAAALARFDSAATFAH